jgi:two-component system OmpR family sensor kinase
VLVENALVHTPAGTTVRVATGLDGGRATLSVANDGPEIPAEARRQIFERFYRLDGTKASGSGLGLAIARQLAEVMGGRIELDGADGWTRFTLVLAAEAGDRELVEI